MPPNEAEHLSAVGGLHIGVQAGSPLSPYPHFLPPSSSLPLSPLPALPLQVDTLAVKYFDAR